MSASLQLVADRPSAPAVAFAARPPRWHLLLSAASCAHAALAMQTVMRAYEVALAGLQGYTDPASGWHHCRGVIDDALACLSIADLRRRLAPLAAQAPLRVHIGAAHNLRRVVVRVFDLFEHYRGDVMVLARFMQVLPPVFCARAAGRILNVHHSLLPAFSGARAYHQAWQQGVKWIGATCHYVTAELDRGPIIDQDARRIYHAQSVDDLVRAGRDLERRVLVAGLRAHVEDRVVVCGQRTVIFDR